MFSCRRSVSEKISFSFFQEAYSSQGKIFTATVSNCSEVVGFNLALYTWAKRPFPTWNKQTWVKLFKLVLFKTQIKYFRYTYQQVQLYWQWLGVVVQAVGVRWAAVWSIVIYHGADVTAVQHSCFWFALLNVSFPFLAVHALTMWLVPVEHSHYHNQCHQQGQQAHQDHRR